MAAFSRSSIKFQTKSISLPSRSHPTTFEIEELLNQMKSTRSQSSPSSDAICISLSQMTGLYKCMNDLLTSSTTTQLLLMSHGGNKKRVEDLVDESVKFLDICGSLRDLLSEMKDHCRDLLCDVRRTKSDQDLIIQNIIMKHSCFTKKVRKQVRGLAATVKQVDQDLSSGGLVMDGSDNQQLAAVIRAVIGVSEMTILVFDSMLVLLSSSSSSVSKPKRWSSVVSKIMQKKKVGCVDRSKNGSVNNIGFKSIEDGLRMLSSKDGFRSQMGNLQQTVICRLERVGDEIESMEAGLECLFRFLVRTRVSLLNIISP